MFTKTGLISFLLMVSLGAPFAAHATCAPGATQSCTDTASPPNDGQEVCLDGNWSPCQTIVSWYGANGCSVVGDCMPATNASVTCAPGPGSSSPKWCTYACNAPEYSWMPYEEQGMGCNSDPVVDNSLYGVTSIGGLSYSYTGPGSISQSDLLTLHPYIANAIDGGVYIWAISGGALINDGGSAGDTSLITSGDGAGQNAVTIDAGSGIVTLTALAFSTWEGGASPVVLSQTIHVADGLGQPVLESRSGYAIGNYTQVQIDNYDFSATYTWSVDSTAAAAGATITPSGLRYANLVAGAGSGNMTVSCIAWNGGVPSAAGTLTLPYYDGSTPLPDPVIQFADPVATAGATYLVASVPNRGGSYQANYTWSASTGATIVDQGGSSQTAFAWFDVTGAVGTCPTITVTESLGGFSSSTTVSAPICIVGWPRSFPAVKWSGSASPNAVIGASVDAVNGMTYEWSVVGGTIIGSTDGTLGSDATNGVQVSITGAIGEAFSISVAEKNAAGISGVPSTIAGYITMPNVDVTVRAGSTIVSNVIQGLTYTATIPAESTATYTWTIENGTIVSDNPSPVTGSTTQVTFTATGTPGTLLQLTASGVGSNIPQQGTAIEQVVSPQPPVWLPTSALSGTRIGESAVSLTWGTAAAGTFAVDEYQVFEDGVLCATTVNLSATCAVAGNYSDSFSVLAFDTAGNSTEPISFAVAQTPVAPIISVPALDSTVITTVRNAVRFIYSQANPPQLNVATGTITDQQLTTIRGTVLSPDMSPITGVTVTAVNHPEFGATLTGADGTFDLAVNGGGQTVVDFIKDGYPRVQRTVSAKYNKYTTLSPITLTPFDTGVTAIDVSGASTQIQVARGLPSTDQDGTRQATLLFLPGTAATLVSDAGTTTPTTLHIRATEYTLGDAGVLAVPGTLPPSSAYTYAVELSADEAIASGAETVQFSKPPILYVENFIGFPTGQTVPTGFYQRDAGTWLDSDNGLVVQILSTESGSASLDVDGSGNAASLSTLTTLGISTQELAVLASLYSAGQKLWRSPIPHFSPWDCNWGFSPPADATGPEQQTDDSDANDPCLDWGSIIECENQVLREQLPLPGTGVFLAYSSDRAAGRTDRFQHVITVSGATVPASLVGITVEVSVAGRQWNLNFPPQPNQTYSFVWDGLDAYGRQMQGEQFITTQVGYVYPTEYNQTNRFGYNGNGEVISGTRQSSTLTLWGTAGNDVWEGYIGGFDAKRAEGLGGWTISNHHYYSPNSATIYFGDGSKKRLIPPNGAPDATISKVAQTIYDSSPPGAHHMDQFAIDSDNSFYFSDDGKIFQMKFDGSSGQLATTYIGGIDVGSGTLDHLLDGTLQTEAVNSVILGLEVNGGVVTYLDQWYDLGGANYEDYTSKVRTFQGGVVKTLLGLTGSASYWDDAPAIDCMIWPFTLSGLGIAPGGGFLVGSGVPSNAADPTATSNASITQFMPGGFLSTVAGFHFNYHTNQAEQILTTLHGTPTAFTSTGELCWGEGTIVRCGNGRTVAGVQGMGPSESWADGPATAETLYVTDLLRGPDNLLYILSNSCITRLDADGWLRAVAGCGPNAYQSGKVASSMYLPAVNRIRFGPDGNLYAAGAGGIFKIGPVYTVPSLANNLLIPSADGSEVYIFDTQGRHLQTVDGLTGVAKATFTYDTNGLIAGFTDRLGNTTAIIRDGSGNPVSINTPQGQVNSISLDSFGYLSALTDPAGVVVHPVSDSLGLLTSLSDRRGNLHTLNYYPGGALMKDTDPEGGFKLLMKGNISGGRSVLVTTAMGRTGPA